MRGEKMELHYAAAAAPSAHVQDGDLGAHVVKSLFTLCVENSADAYG